ncbi:MAG: hypothetical protein ABIJ34_06100 [archaeon]
MYSLKEQYPSNRGMTMPGLKPCEYCSACKDGTFRLKYWCKLCSKSWEK